MKNKMGFTLIELLVAVLIIGILAAIALPQYRYAVAKTKFSQLLLATKAIKEAQTRYIMLHGERSLDLSILDIDIQGGTYERGKTSSKTNDAISFDWGGCGIAFSSGRKLFSCYLDKPYVRYYRYFENSNKICCASKESGELGKKLCQAEFPGARGKEVDTYCGDGGTIYKNFK